MKYLVIAALVSLAFVLVYSRIRPYLKFIQKIAQSLNVAAEVTTADAGQEKTPSRNKLVRCESCGTWIPAERAMQLKSGLATFCSPECMAKKATSKERKIAS